MQDQFSSGRFQGTSAKMGPFKLVKKLGSGGMASVYLVQREPIVGGQPELLALKVIHPSLLIPPDDRVILDRFRAEFASVDLLNRRERVSTVVQVYELYEDQNITGFTMEYLPKSLDDLVKEEIMDVPKTIRMLKDIGIALFHAHKISLIHRDVNPNNIRIREDSDLEEFVLADFGIVKDFRNQTMTRTGTSIGTPHFMSPEQASAEPVNERTDIYALGATAFYCLTNGEVIPFDVNPNSPQYLAALRDLQIPKTKTINQIRKEKGLEPISKKLESIIDKCIEKDPLKRYQSIREFINDIQAFEDRKKVSAFEPAYKRFSKNIVSRVKERLRKHPRSFAAAGILAASLAIGLIAYRAHSTSQEINKFFDQARQSIELKNYDDATAAYSKILGIDKNNSLAQQGITRARALKFDDVISKAQEEFSKYTSLKRSISELEQQILESQKRIKGSDPWEAKRPYWKNVKEKEKKVVDLGSIASRIIEYLSIAVSIDDKDSRTNEVYSDFYFEKWHEAFEQGNIQDIEYFKSLVRRYDSLGKYREQLAEKGFVNLDSNPSGASVYVFKYAEHGEIITEGDIRLVPVPFNPQRGLLSREEYQRISEEDTAYPLSLSDFNLVGMTPINIELSNGSYLLVVKKEGFSDARHPVFIESFDRSVANRSTVNLPASEKILPGFVYVSGGEFLQGENKQRATVDDFCISRFEVTVEEYMRFLNDPETLANVGEEGSLRYVPRKMGGFGSYFQEKDENNRFIINWESKWPIIAISWNDANDYCKWLTKQYSLRGENINFRLPTSKEWEKAGRGVDGRDYPWGDLFDWCFTNGYETIDTNRVSPGIIGIILFDESPYSVRDMAGNVSEWTGRDDEFFNPVKRFRTIMGGAFSYSNKMNFLIFGEKGMLENEAYPIIGFRICYSLSD